jgi:serine/threonine protein kinase
MSEAVLDNAIEQIADGLTVDWNAIDKAGPSREREWAKSLRVLNDIVRLHREAAADYEQTTLVNAAPRSASASDTWGKYRLADKVGEGSYGAVYRAWDSELERDVAIKILHQRVGDTRLKERLLQEGRALAKIRHNNVVSVLGIEAHADRVGLCMEYVRGKTLADIVRGHGKMSAAEAVLIGEDLCRALSAVHRAGYIHRDVKAKNVMRDDTGRIVLMDFGTGRTAEAAQGKGDRAGTPLYMAPEVLDGGPASARSDVYSLGVLLYNVVTGDYPVKANSVDELRDAHARREHRWLSELRPDLPVAFMQVVERAIALDAEERYASAGELLSALSGLKLNTDTWIWRLAKPVIALGVIVAGMILLGVITSTHFNLSFQRSEFASETIGDYLVWGRRTSFPPFLILLVVLLGATIVVWLRRLLVAVLASVRRLDAAVRSRLASLAHSLRLDEVPVLASCALMISATVVSGALWYFLPLVLALIKLPMATEQELTLLSPASVALHNQYRWIFSLAVMLSVAVWYPVAKLVRKGQSLHWGLIAGGVVATSIAMALLHFPYRMLYFSAIVPFETVSWNGTRCYVTGSRADDRLLFCPELAPPRNRTIKSTDKGLIPLSVRENPFSRYSGGGYTSESTTP